MSFLKQLTQAAAARALYRDGMSQQQLCARTKKVGRTMLLAGVVAVIPLVVLNHVPVAVIILLQLLYAALICGGLVLAFDDKKAAGR